MENEKNIIDKARGYKKLAVICDGDGSTILDWCDKQKLKVSVFCECLDKENELQNPYFDIIEDLLPDIFVLVYGDERKDIEDRLRMIGVNTDEQLGYFKR